MLGGQIGRDAENTSAANLYVRKNKTPVGENTAALDEHIQRDRPPPGKHYAHFSNAARQSQCPEKFLGLCPESAQNLSKRRRIFTRIFCAVRATPCSKPLPSGRGLKQCTSNLRPASPGRKLDLRPGQEERGNEMERASSDVIGQTASQAFCRPSTSTGRSRADRRRIRRYTACARPACRASAARRRRRGCRAVAGA